MYRPFAIRTGCQFIVSKLCTNMHKQELTPKITCIVRRLVLYLCKKSIASPCITRNATGTLRLRTRFYAQRTAVVQWSAYFLRVWRHMQWVYMGKNQNWYSETSLPFLLGGAFGGSCATLTARPKAPGKELLSLTTNVPGDLSFSIVMAVNPSKEIRLDIGMHYLFYVVNLFLINSSIH